MKYIVLNNGSKMPQIGLGTWKSGSGEVGEAVKFAILGAGYRQIDCASVYGNEKEIGQAFEEIFATGKVKREELFVTSKLWNDAHGAEDVEIACRKTLEDLRLEYLDLYLVHWGIAVKKDSNFGGGEHLALDRVPLSETWQAMENLVEEGLVKSIGVSNFNVQLLNDLLSYAKVKPVMNQVELHPYNVQPGLVEFCQKSEVALTAYSPLGRPGYHEKEERGLYLPETLVKNLVINRIAERYNKTPAQILLRFSIERGLVCIPKSTRPERIKENIDIFEFSLSKDDMDQLFALDIGYRYVKPSVWGWITYFD